MPYEWWPGVAIVGILLVAAAVWSWVAYRKMRGDRERVLEELRDARRELEDSRRELGEAHRALDEARRDWQEAIRQLTPRLEEHEKKTSEVIQGLKQWQKDRKKLGLRRGWEMRAEAVIKGGQVDRGRLRQQLAGLRTALDGAVDRLKHLAEQTQSRRSSGLEDEPPAQPDRDQA